MVSSFPFGASEGVGRITAPIRMSESPLMCFVREWRTRSAEMGAVSGERKNGFGRGGGLGLWGFRSRLTGKLYKYEPEQYMNMKNAPVYLAE